MKIAFGISWNDSKKGQLLAAVGLTLGLLLASTPGFGESAARAASQMVDVIVRELPGAGSAPEQMVEDLGGDVGRHIDIIDGFTATVPEAGLPALESVRKVHSVTPDQRVFLQHSVDGYDASSASNPGSIFNTTNAVKARDMWREGFTGKGVDVAMIDSGVVPVEGLTVPGKVVNGPDLSLESGSPARRYLDTFGHGTHMAGIIAGRDAAVVAGKENGDHDNFVGVAPDARIVNVKVAAHNGGTDVSQVLAAIDWVVQHRNSGGLNIRVLNLSFGTDGTQSYLTDPLTYAVENAWHKGIVVVVAAGNSQFGSAALNNPAYDPYVVAVGASDTKGTFDTSDDVVPDWSARGDGVRNPDLVAPGKSVASLRTPGSFLDVNHPEGRVNSRLFKGSGTSQAAAVVSGAAALLVQQRPNATPDQIKALLKSTASTMPAADAQAQGAGVVNLKAALKAPTPLPLLAAQTWPRATGTGSLEKSRGSVHLVMTHPSKSCVEQYMEQKAAAEKAAADQGAAEPAPAVEETVAPVVEETVEPAVEETVEPAVEETVDPAVEDTVEPLVDETAESVTNLAETAGATPPDKESVEPATAPAETVAETSSPATEPAPQAPAQTLEEACPPVDHVLEGERDIFGNDWNGATWSGATWSGRSWSGGEWNGATWSGATWSGDSWAGATWSGATWSGRTWSGATWSGATWSGRTWSGATWSGATWSGATWSGATWSGATWSGATWSGATWSGATWSGATWSGATWSGATWSGATWSGIDWS
ncbi:MAG TPA: S8 family serine peptidase [Actinomycetota bacterium]|nr:S8 family serine peptidase [Actinomycetota bacterium]